ncbi:hypothetical protein D3C85_1740240 [compost metagenome]
MAIDIVTHAGEALRPLCTHSFGMENGTEAVRTLGREVTDGRDAIHITLTPE